MPRQQSAPATKVRTKRHALSTSSHGPKWRQVTERQAGGTTITRKISRNGRLPGEPKVAHMLSGPHGQAKTQRILARYGRLNEPKSSHGRVSGW